MHTCLRPVIGQLFVVMVLVVYPTSTVRQCGHSTVMYMSCNNKVTLTILDPSVGLLAYTVSTSPATQDCPVCVLSCV